MRTTILVALVGCIAGAVSLSAQEPRTERVQFEPGASSATVKGRIKGYETVHYLMGAKAGQSMVVALTTDNDASYFNIFAPGKKPGQDGAMFIGSTEGNRYEGELPADGDYLVQVYMMRSAARRGEVASYTLEVAIKALESAPTVSAR